MLSRHVNGFCLRATQISHGLEGAVRHDMTYLLTVQMAAILCRSSSWVHLSELRVNVVVDGKLPVRVCTFAWTVVLFST